MSILFLSYDERAPRWLPHLEAAMPGREIQVWPEVEDLARVRYAVVCQPPAGVLKQCPNLEAVFSMWAGIDHLKSDPERPPEIPVVRMVERGLSTGMCEYVTMQVLFHHRRMLDYRAQQARAEWKPLPLVPAWRRKVGIMGFGELGQLAAEKLVGLELDVAGWSRSPKSMDGVACYHGDDGLDAFLARSEILVCLLPLTEATRGILNAVLFAKLPRGACLINAARGGHLVDTDLLEALDSGQLDSASLDVFDPEPLPSDHPFWSHPRIVLTPHVAAGTLPETASESIAANIARHERGEPFDAVVDFSLGY